MPSYVVTLQPSNHRFNTSQKQSVLAAGLSAGLNLRYGCENGTCGKCLCRLVDGQVRAIRHSDFHLSDDQKANGYFLGCCHAAQSDCLIEAEEIDSIHDIPQQLIRTRVYKLQYLADDVLAVALKTPRTQPLSFIAGQSVTLHLPHNLKRHKSVASCPCDGLKPEFHFKYRPGDAFSEYVFKRLKKNDNLEIQGPSGNCVLDDESCRPFIFIALNSGFSSIKSLMEHTISLDKEQPVGIYWIVTPDNSHYMDNYCRSIQDALDNFSYYPLAIPDASTEALSLVLKKILHKEKAIKQADIFITLPEMYRHLAEPLFTAAGLNDDHWWIDTLDRL